MARVRHLDDAETVAAALRDVPLDPVTDTVMLSVLDRCRTDPTAFPDRNWWIAEDDAGVVGVAFQTPPWPLGLGLDAGPWLADLVDTLLRARWPVVDVSCERPLAEAFAAAWTARTGLAWSLVRALRLLRCVELVVPDGVEGQARLVAPEEQEQLAGWLEAFTAELDLLPQDEGLQATRVLGRAWWWVNAGGEPVSLAVYGPPQRGVARVGPVYTPPAHRRHGYAAAATAAATQAAYDSGATQVVLHTDVANPTSNAVYERIGYVYESDAVHLRLDVPPTPR
jgi:predicted GNAT family acetyltransferase